MEQVSINLEIIGCLWRGTDVVQFSARYNGDIIHCAIPALERAIAVQALQRGISVGDMCDIINEQLREADMARLRESGLPYGEVTFQITPKQASAFDALFKPGVKK